MNRPKLSPEHLAKMAAGREATRALLKQSQAKHANETDPSESISRRNASSMGAAGIHARQKVTLHKESGSKKWNKFYEGKEGHIAAMNLSDAEVLVKAEGFASNGLWFRLNELSK